jgi:hypothetical protein
MRLILGLAFALSVSAPLPAAEPTPNTPATLDVVVEDSRGRAIDTLGPADFSVTEQSRPLAVDSVRFVRPGASGAGSTAVPVSAPLSGSTGHAGRVIAIYLDEFHVVPGATARAAR